ncbi:MAG: ABC transporter ATP-binding protein [Spirochaetales bacterium]|nr:ABC transporter ATP-binding protein [Spirochaetales bacterium]
MEDKKIKIRIEKLRKAWGEVVAVNDIDLDILEGDFLTLLGPSGCGKTTTLRAIAGLEEPTGGKIFINGNLVFSKKDEVIVAPSKRQLGLIFQSYALWPHMTVNDNIAFGLKIKKFPKEEIDVMVKAILEDVHLEGYGERYPSELSGGQQQRVAIARMLVNRPQIFLMDEPLSNLDARLRIEMRSELIQLHNRTNATTIYVTHDQEEAMTLSTRICVMCDGVIRQIGAPEEIYGKPADLFVAGFISNPQMNFFEGKVVRDGAKTSVDAGGFLVDVSSDIIGDRNEVVFAVRPEDFIISKEGAAYSVKTRLPTGSSQIAMVTCGDEKDVALMLDGEVKIASGDNIKLQIKNNKYHLFDKKTEKRIN